MCIGSTSRPLPLVLRQMPSASFHAAVWIRSTSPAPYPLLPPANAAYPHTPTMPPLPGLKRTSADGPKEHAKSGLLAGGLLAPDPARRRGLGATGGASKLEQGAGGPPAHGRGGAHTHSLKPDAHAKKGAKGAKGEAEESPKLDGKHPHQVRLPALCVSAAMCVPLARPPHRKACTFLFPAVRMALASSSKNLLVVARTSLPAFVLPTLFMCISTLCTRVLACRRCTALSTCTT